MVVVGLREEVSNLPVHSLAGLGHEADVLAALQPDTNTLVIRVYTNLSNLPDKDAHQRYGLFGQARLLVK